MTTSSPDPRPLDGDRTTVDWQTALTRIAVLPIGAFEQHGGRLPLRTDTLLAEYFSRRLALALDAALLPAIAYATSLENGGFRGTISIRPETAMALIRDLVASLEQQNFQHLIVVNGHGGNFFLGPVLREINAEDRRIKVLTVDCGGHFETSPEGRCLHDGELHAGASEISRMLVIRPELVGTREQALPLARTPDPHFLRSDLNTFGIGVRDPSGVWGDPAGGDPATGQAMVDSIAANQLRHVRERLAWLAANPGYTGAGGIAMRPMVEADIDDGLRLCRLAGWNQRLGDWRLFLDLHRPGCHVAVRMGSVVGTVTTLRHDAHHGWISMVLVDPQHRRLGLGTRLLQQALEALSACATVALDATPAGKPVYERLGFTDMLTLVRLIRRQGPRIESDPDATVRPMSATDLAAVAALDRATIGSERMPLLHWLFAQDPSRAWVATAANGAIIGFTLGRPGEVFDQIGPLVANDRTVAESLFRAAIAPLGNRPVGIDIPEQPAWQPWLERHGFSVERGFTRMIRGVRPTPQHPERLFAIAGPELG